MTGWFVAVVCLGAGISAAHAQAAECHAGLKAQEVAELLFGRNIGGHIGVSEAQFERFVAREISSRFPDGLTILDGRGEWRDTARGTTVHEPSKVVEIVLPGKADDIGALNQIAAAYKSAFHQQSVGIVVRSACVAF
jgi:hypothetical protein